MPPQTAALPRHRRPCPHGPGSSCFHRRLRGASVADVAVDEVGDSPVRSPARTVTGSISTARRDALVAASAVGLPVVPLQVVDVPLLVTQQALQAPRMRSRGRRRAARRFRRGAVQLCPVGKAASERWSTARPPPAVAPARQPPYDYAEVRELSGDREWRGERSASRLRSSSRSRSRAAPTAARRLELQPTTTLGPHRRGAPRQPSPQLERHPGRGPEGRALRRGVASRSCRRRRRPDPGSGRSARPVSPICWHTGCAWVVHGLCMPPIA